MRPLAHRNPNSRIKENRGVIRHERRKPALPGPWIYVGDWVAPDDPGNDPPLTTWQSVPWQNGFTWLGNAYVAFRHGLDGETEFTGTIDTAGAVTATVAFTLPVPFRPEGDFSFLTDMDMGGGTFTAARVFVDAASGDVTLYWPIT